MIKGSYGSIDKEKTVNKLGYKSLEGDAWLEQDADIMLRGFIHVASPENTFLNREIIFLAKEIRLLKTVANKISDKISKMNLGVNMPKDAIYDNAPAAIPNKI